MENFLPDLPARCAAVAAGKKKKKKKRGRKETTGKCGRVQGGECGSELVLPLLVVVVVLCVCVLFWEFGGHHLYSEYLFSRWYCCLIWRFGARREARSLTMVMTIGF